MKGRLALDHTPYVTLAIPEGGAEKECVIDTGFNGSLYLAENEIAEMNLRFLTSAPISLADQSLVIADVFEVTVMWFSVARRVPVIAGPVGCDALIGMELLKGCGIELDDVAGEVRIQRLYH